MKQHTTPMIIKGGRAQKLEKVSLNSKTYNEDWIQELCFQNPSILPIEEIEPTFSGMIPVCRELRTESGFVDLIFINEYGFITVGECKLWRNPEARRKVIGQILDYAKDLSKWDYSKFENECLKSRKIDNQNLFEIVQELYPDTVEAEFIDNVQNNLKKGRFLLGIIGDGIRENMEELASYIHQYGNMNFTLSLIELPLYLNPQENEIIISPRILARTKEIERIVFRVSDTEIKSKQIESQKKVMSKSVSETVFFERLENAIGKENANGLKNFADTLHDKLNIYATLGRGKRLSLNLKSSNDSYNFASIQEDGEVWFYGIVNKTEEIGDKQIGIEYLKSLGKEIGGKLDDSYKEWNWCVKRDGKYINIVEYLKKKQSWLEIISNTLEKIDQLEDNR